MDDIDNVSTEVGSSRPVDNAPALDDIRVLDFTSHLSGPFCTMILADLGADVVKIERAGMGDDARQMPPHVGGEGGPFMQINRNKRSVALDLKDPEDAALCHALALDADILVENFKPGTIERLGFGFTELSKANPRLIHCSISGYGQTGPNSHHGGFDLMMQAASGLMSICGPQDGPPHRLPVPVSDLSAGMFAAIGILAALAQRNRTGTGQQVDCSLFEAAVSFGVYEAAHVFATNSPPQRLGQAHRGSAPYQVFKTADGWLTIGGAAQHLWERLCHAIGAPGLIDDPRFKTTPERVNNRAELEVVLNDIIATRRTDQWTAIFESEGIPCAPVETWDKVLVSDHVRARGMIRDVVHPTAGATQVLGSPIHLSATQTRIRRPAPRLGEHTDEVRREVQERSTRRAAG